MKVVINTRYGGFGLSHEAMMKYAELKGMELFPRIDDISESVYGAAATLSNPSVIIHYTTVPWEEYQQLLEEDGKNPVGIGRYAKSNAVYFSGRDIARDDETLIRVIKLLGKKVNTRFSELKIVKIPDDVGWKIEECDGIEWIAEKHRTWR